MNTLEPLCTGEQTKMLQQLGLNVLIDPTISLAKNWLWEKYGLWMETQRSSVVCDRFIASYYLQDEPHIHTSSLNPHTAESDCLTEVLKKLTNEKSNS